MLHATVPENMAEGCAVPFTLDSGFLDTIANDGHSPQSQTVPLAVSRTPGQCRDPLPDSSGVIRLERVFTSGYDPPEEFERLTVEFMSAQGRMLRDEGDPGLLLHPSEPDPAIGLCSGYRSRIDSYDRAKGPHCLGFEGYLGRFLDPGAIRLEREGWAPLDFEPLQTVENWGFTTLLPRGFLAQGKIRVRGLGSPDVAPFEAAVEFRDVEFEGLAPGTQIEIPRVRWSGGNPEDRIRAIFGRPTDGYMCVQRIGLGEAGPLPDLTSVRL